MLFIQHVTHPQHHDLSFSLSKAVWTGLLRSSSHLFVYTILQYLVGPVYHAMSRCGLTFFPFFLAPLPHHFRAGDGPVSHVPARSHCTRLTTLSLVDRCNVASLAPMAARNCTHSASPWTTRARYTLCSRTLQKSRRDRCISGGGRKSILNLHFDCG